MATGKEMCELACKYLKEIKNINMTPMQLWNYGSRGDLQLVYSFYWEAKAHYENLEMKIDDKGYITWIKKGAKP